VGSITDPGLLLKVTPPKLRKTLLVRERLRRIGAADDDMAVILSSARKATASGAWRQTHSSKDGAIGTYTVTYTP